MFLEVQTILMQRKRRFPSPPPGGVRLRLIFYTQTNHNFRICLPKKSLLFIAYPKKSLSPFFATQKNILASFIDPKNHFGPNSRPKKITQTPLPSLPPPPPIIKICESDPWGRFTDKLCLNCSQIKTDSVWMGWGY